MTLLRLLAICCLLVPAHHAAAARLEIPLRVSLDALQQALGEQLTGYREGRCRFLKLKAPRLQAQDGRLRLSVPGTGALGVEVAGTCQTAAAWRGSLHFTLAPRIDDTGRVRVTIVDSRASGMAPALWDAGKRHLHPRLERFSYDLGASRDALAALLRGAATPVHAPAMAQALEQLQVLQPQVEATHVLVPIALEIPDAWLAAAPSAAAPGAPLTEAELEALEKALEPWDAFLVTIVRQVATDGEDSALRRRLFTLLLDSRYQLSAMLSGDVQAQGDPLRALFLETWSELRAILVDAQRAGALPPSLLRYAVFVDAADALAAVEGAAPGLALSAEGLRQLARSLRPGETADPLAYDWALDPQLGELFEVEALPEAEPPPALPQRSWLDFFISGAHADNALDHWVPTRAELASYGSRVGGVLHKSAASEAQRARLAAPYGQIYQYLVPATALIESCWRQYVVRNGKVTYLRSQSSSVGVMQINQRVWRGFYDIERVRWDTAYNIRAGAQILMRYLKDYAIPYAERTGKPGDVARAAYAVYNAGPRAVGRFAKSPPHPREARVDAKLWTLYQGIAGGGQVDLATCGVITPGTPSAARAQ
ncbi:MAG TPA: lytic transglycosylase domain-containing protein [Burkholderiales bacterium]|nr:lytic transglycosylase domain-containing protein [Burkholderiales bacterium]